MIRRSGICVLSFCLGLAACVHAPVGPAGKDAVDVRISGSDCLPVSREGLRLSLTNTGSRRVGFDIYPSADAPHALHPGNWEVLVEGSSGAFDPWEPDLSHFVEPERVVSLGPGDSAEFELDPSLWPSAHDAQRFVLQVRNTRGRAYRSQPMKVCSVLGETASAK